LKRPVRSRKDRAMAKMTTAEAEKRFAEQDKHWDGPRFIRLGAITLAICITAIYLMSTTQGCSLQIV
jgi:hypothetical protein